MLETPVQLSVRNPKALAPDALIQRDSVTSDSRRVRHVLGLPSKVPAHSLSLHASAFPEPDWLHSLQGALKGTAKHISAQPRRVALVGAGNF